VGWWDFALYRFLCGVGVGGDYAAGMTFVAEVMPDRARPYCLGLLQGLAGLGQVAGSAISLMIGPQADLAGVPGWRLLFAVGVFPVVMVAVIRRTLHEPPSWLRAKQQADDQGPDEVHTRLGDLGDIFRDRRWRYHALIGMTLGVVGQLGTWGIAFWTPELIRGALRETRTLEAGDVQGRPTGAVARSSNRATGATAGLHLRQDPGDQGFHTVRGKEPHAQPRRWKAEEDRLVARGTLLLDLAGILGIYTFTLVTARVGRRWTFAGAFLLAASATVWTFAQLRQPADVYWMVLLLGFGVSSVFGGYAIYFPELFPTRLRSTGTGFCYNVARYLTALGPLTLGRLTLLYASLGHALPLRPAAISLASVYLIGLLALPFAPETRGRPLPE
jgi:MFS family permease